MFDMPLEHAFALAVGEVKKRHHEFFTLEHLLYGILLDDQGKILLGDLNVNVASLRRSLEQFFSEHVAPLPYETDEVIQTMALQRVIQRSLRQMHSFGREYTGIGDVLVNLLDEEGAHAAFFLSSQGVTRLDVMELISFDSGPAKDTSEDEAKQDDSANSKALHKYTTDLTAQAEKGLFDPLVGREAEMDRAIQVLSRRRKNNPLLVGDPGVGKTALAEGLASRIASGHVPAQLKGSRLFSLDLAGMMAGAKYRGDFEARLKSVLGALAKIPYSLLFIDEIHTIVGAGAVSGSSLDASNILKPALGAGELRCIGSTTFEEQRNYLEKDKAFSRRFQVITVPEPTRDECVAILKGLKSRYEGFHGVRYTPAALEAAVALSARYMTDTRLPDKAIDLIDEAGAQKRIAAEKKADNEGMQKKKRHISVSVADIEHIVANIARIPAVKATETDKVSLKHLDNDLKKVVFGQDDAVMRVTKAVLRSRAGLHQENRPQGAFLFYGPTGVGKTELAKQLAASLHVPFLRFDMSEYMEKHAVARLIGAPPGYVGFDQGGLLTEAVRKTPNAVLLLDEMEKAHFDIFNILLQVMDYATLTDNAGRKADFRNIIIIMTTNAGAFEMATRNIGFGTPHATGAITTNVKKTLERLFTPEFRNRLDALVPFAFLGKNVMRHIVEKFITNLKKALHEKKVQLSLSGAAYAYLAEQGYDPVYGARPLARVIREQIEDPLAVELLFGKLSTGGEVSVDVQGYDKKAIVTKTSDSGKVLDKNMLVSGKVSLVFSYAKSTVKKQPNLLCKKSVPLQNKSQSKFFFFQ